MESLPIILRPSHDNCLIGRLKLPCFVETEKLASRRRRDKRMPFKLEAAWQPDLVTTNEEQLGAFFHPNITPYVFVCVLRHVHSCANFT